ncbi:hypothetical protein KIH13_12305 [Pseudomonas viridiflava]|nr:hypothetical protein KIH13_12305 [Pseudomonas viridiflava]
MSNEFKLVPGIWHPISEINDTNRYELSFLLHCPGLICSDFNPSGVVEGHWCDDEGWQAAVWCGYHDEFHTKFVTPTLIMTIPSIAAPQPPALGGECVPLSDGDLIRLANIAAPHHDRDNDMFYIAMGKLVADPLHAEIGRLKDNVREVTTYRDNAIKKIERLRNELTGTEKESDLLKARFDELQCDHEWTDDGEFNLHCTKCGKQENHEPYGWVQTRGNAINRFTQEWDVVEEWEAQGFEYKAMFDAALSKPAGSEQV